MAASPSKQQVVGAAAALVVISRIRDIRHLPRLFVDPSSTSLAAWGHIWASASAIFGYERLVAAILRRLGLSRMPSTLAAMLSLFAMLRITEKTAGKETSDRLANLLKPGVDFLGKWMGLFLAPPLVSLDASVQRLPSYGASVWVKLATFIGAAWATTHASAGLIATSLAPADAGRCRSAPLPAKQEEPVVQACSTEVSQDEAVRRVWILLGALGFLGVSCSSVLPPILHRPVGMLSELSTTIASFLLTKMLPPAAQKVIHPLVGCAISSNLAMGCSAHSIGTAGLISLGDTEAAAISGASMCLAGTVHTLLLQLPGVVSSIRTLALLPSTA